MKQLQFIFSILVTLCAISMFIGMLISAVPVRFPFLAATGMLVVGCSWLVYVLYKELKA